MSFSAYLSKQQEKAILTPKAFLIGMKMSLMMLLEQNGILYVMSQKM